MLLLTGLNLLASVEVPGIFIPESTDGGVAFYASEHALLAWLEQQWEAVDEPAVRLEVEHLLSTARDRQVQLAAWGLLFRHAEDPVGFLKERLRHPDPVVRRDAIRRVDELPGDFRQGSQLLALVSQDPAATVQLLHFLVDRRDPSILPKLRECHSAADVQQLLHREFVGWFDAHTAGPVGRYQGVARDIWELWQRHMGHCSLAEPGPPADGGGM